MGKGGGAYLRGGCFADGSCQKGTAPYLSLPECSVHPPWLDVFLSVGFGIFFGCLKKIGRHVMFNFFGRNLLSITCKGGAHIALSVCLTELRGAIAIIATTVGLS